jgi:cell division protein FtsL
MGLPALKQEPRPVARRPHLRVVENTPAPKPKRRAATSHAVARRAFVFFAVIVGVAAVLGAGRVWLSVQAAQASIDCGRLQTAIKAARYEGDMLEIQESALATPSRIQAEAVGTMGMAPATSVSYLRLEPGPAGTTQIAEAPAPSASPVGQAVLNDLVGMVAVQARMLLVGDAGLASSK